MQFSWLILFVCVFLSTTCDARTIKWLTHDFAPYYILSGPDKSQGRDESIISLLEQQLPHINFERVIIPSGKVIQELANQQSNACALSLYKNKYREERVYFTHQSSTAGLSPSIAMHQKLSAALDIESSESVSLTHLLVKKQLTLGVSMNRSYGSEIDKIINTTPNTNIVIRPTRDTLSTLTYMLNLERIDILLGYPSEHYYLAKTMGFSDNLTQRMLTEAPKISYGYIGCTKNEQGAEDIATLNQQLKMLKQTKEYKQVLTRWLPNDLKPKLTLHLQ
ncbi:TIGR02285 family protein [Pseudoalteromonas sp. SK18]|uniref:TIGR02285 family protein n=1 Tax=Pseudoalteromonas sp. SK18 TaxID=1938366 RepID=UPI0009785534|nr:TIGR02285 family protein [Pseudoalteromonas sp. SK18]